MDVTEDKFDVVFSFFVFVVHFLYEIIYNKGNIKCEGGTMLSL